MAYDPKAPRPHTRKPKPGAWITGPDPIEHHKYRVFIQQKNQAQYRDEGWSITFEEWKKIWAESGYWEQRGRKKGCYCMTRHDWSTPWTVANAVVVTREKHAQMQGFALANGWRSMARKKVRQKMGLD